jgi:hypothetical protein
MLKVVKKVILRSKGHFEFLGSRGYMGGGDVPGDIIKRSKRSKKVQFLYIFNQKKLKKVEKSYNLTDKRSKKVKRGQIKVTQVKSKEVKSPITDHLP